MPLFSGHHWQHWTIAALSTLPLWGMAAAPVLAQSPARTGTSPAVQNFGNMFSQEIQQTLAACAEQGQVSLAAGADRDRSVVCMDGSRNSPIAYNTYIDTLSNVLAAGGLVGLQTALGSNPNVTPEGVAQLFSSDAGKEQLRTMLEGQLSSTGVLAPQDPPTSIRFLVGQVLDRLLPALQNPRSNAIPARTASAYNLVVKNFCTPPGSSVNQIRTQLPDLKPVQIFAICLQEAGLDEEMRRQVNP